MVVVDGNQSVDESHTQFLLKLFYICLPLSAQSQSQSDTETYYHNEVNGICQAIKCFLQLQQLPYSP